MRLKFNFGHIESKEVHWWKPLDDIPKIIKFLGRNYEWVLYDKDITGAVDTILTYAELPIYDPNFGVDCTTWQEMFGEDTGGCQCGAAYTSFPGGHMFFCRRWTKI